MTDRVGGVRNQTCMRPRPQTGRDRARQLRALTSLLGVAVASLWFLFIA